MDSPLSCTVGTEKLAFLQHMQQPEVEQGHSLAKHETRF